MVLITVEVPARCSTFQLCPQPPEQLQDEQKPRLPAIRNSAARKLGADGSNVAAGRALLAHILGRSRGVRDLPQPLVFSSASDALEPCTRTTDERWALFASCLRRISNSWFSRIRGHMLSNPDFWAGIENFPMVLCVCDNFRRQMILAVESGAVADVQKQAIAEALLRFNEPALCAQVAFLFKVRLPSRHGGSVAVRRSAARVL